MQAVIIVIHLMIVIFLIGIVLLQKSEGGGLGMGGGAGFMSSRGTGNVLTLTTWILAGLFFATSLGMAWHSGYTHKETSILPAQTQQQPVAPPSSGGLLDTLKKADQQQQNQAPAGPQVPKSQ